MRATALLACLLASCVGLPTQLELGAGKGHVASLDTELVMATLVFPISYGQGKPLPSRRCGGSIGLDPLSSPEPELLGAGGHRDLVAQGSSGDEEWWQSEALLAWMERLAILLLGALSLPLGKRGYQKMKNGKPKL